MHDLARAVTWMITAMAVTGVIVRPFDLMEAIWPVGAVAVLLLSGLIPAEHRVDRNPQRHRRLSVPDRHDVAGGGRAEGRLF